MFPKFPAKEGGGICNNDKNDCRERYEEPAAVMEFEGGLSRREAERFAIMELCPKLVECLNFSTW